MKSKKKMKTNFLTLAALLLAGAAVVSCSKDTENTNPETQAAPVEVKTYTMTVEASKGGETRALADAGTTLTSTWSVGDVVKVYNSSNTEIGELTAQSAGASTTLSGTLTTLPSNGDELTLKYLSPTYNTQDGTLTGSDNSIDKVCDYAEATVTATVSGTSVTTGAASFASKQAIVKFTLKNGDGALSTTKFIVYVGGIEYEVNPASAASVIYVALPGFSEKAITLTAPVGNDTYTYEKTDVSFTDGKFYRITVKMTDIMGSAPDGCELVDLGLSVKWANMNVGATSVTDYGDYFAWGETVGYSSDTSDGRSFNWASYKWCNGSYDTMTKYCTDSSYGTVDNKTVLDLEDDVAYVNWGSSWRMPTITEIDELLNNTTHEWTTQNGVYGRKFTSTTNGNSIFLPAAGYRDGSSLYNQTSYGYYWSSSLNESLPYYARYLRFNSENAYPYYYYRYIGFTVRPVLRN